jgi:hypothetical protein
MYRISVEIVNKPINQDVVNLNAVLVGVVAASGPCHCFHEGRAGRGGTGGIVGGIVGRGMVGGRGVFINSL